RSTPSVGLSLRKDWRVYHLFVFFFQAEDGIRDLIVTGVQTCALPICLPRRRGRRCLRREPGDLRWASSAGAVTAARVRAGSAPRSEERRVGKGGRSRVWGGCNK